MRLIRDNKEDYEYYRDAGHWSVGVKSEGGELFTVSEHKILDNIELIEITKQEWAIENKEDAPKSIPVQQYSRNSFGGDWD